MKKKPKGDIKFVNSVRYQIRGVSEKDDWKKKNYDIEKEYKKTEKRPHLVLSYFLNSGLLARECRFMNMKLKVEEFEKIAQQIHDQYYPKRLGGMKRHRTVGLKKIGKIR
jgi:hypothetical protein